MIIDNYLYERTSRHSPQVPPYCCALDAKIFYPQYRDIVYVLSPPDRAAYDKFCSMFDQDLWPDLQNPLPLWRADKLWGIEDKKMGFVELPGCETWDTFFRIKKYIITRLKDFVIYDENLVPLAMCRRT